MNKFKKITKEFNYKFNTTQAGLYSITLEATGKSGKILGLFGGEDLRVEIDGIKLREIPARGKPQYFNIPPTWNGTKLKGLSKIIVFVLQLNKGAHVIKFIPKKGAIIQRKPEIKPFNLQDKILQNIQAQDGNRRPWITLVLIDLPLNILDVSITCEKRFRDSDDVKLAVDGQIQKNKQTKIWGRNWYWRGSELQGNIKEARFYPNLLKGIHYIEFWADRTPLLDNIVLDWGEIKIKDNKLMSKIALYQDVEASSFVNIRSAPRIADNKTFQLKNGDKVEILEEVREGDYVQNKSDIWHKIRYQGKEGYILSSFVEIEGQERFRIIERIKTQARLKNINENFAVALAGCESHYKPYAVSATGARGIYQLTGITRQDLKERFNFEISEEESFDVDKNIEAGLKYLKWLINVYQGTQDEYKKIIAAYNAGKSLIPVQGVISYANIKNEIKKEEAKNLVRCVETNRKKRNWKYIISFVFLLFALSGAIFATHQVLGNEIINETRFKFYNPYPEIESIEVSRISRELTEWQTVVQVKTREEIYRQEYPGFLENAYLFNFNFYPELFLVRLEGQQVLTSILQYNKKTKSLQPIKFIEKDGKESISLCCSYVVFKPFENGVQYDLAIHIPNYDKETSQYLGEYEIIYEYNFLDNVFYEKEKTYIADISGG